ncbi:MAG: FAD-dependent oxidoreductase, partial [Dehalococcoidia bacterium]
MTDFDVVVLGGGWGGYSAAVRAAQNGLRSALVERDKLGGTCLHRGCIPTKVLIETADLLALTSRSTEYGIRLAAPELDYGRVLERKQKVVDQLYSGLQRLVKASGTTIFAGEGRLAGPGSVEVRDAAGAISRIEARSVIIATGSRPRALPGVVPDGLTVVDSDQLLDRPRVPRSLIVLGAGAVGVEFASCFHDYGAQVT